MKEHLYFYRVTQIISIFDGDSLRVELDLGRHLRDRWPLRLARINTPELRDPDPVKKAKAYAARDYLRNRLDTALAANLDIIIRSVKLEKYGRALAELYVEGVNINDELLQKGYAEPYKE